MVYCESADGKLGAVATEMLGCGKRLANDLGQELSATLIGSEVKDLARIAISFGADKVYVVDHPMFKEYQTESYLTAMEKVACQVMPQIILLGQTSVGRDLAPRFAFKLNTGLSMDCIDLTIDPESKLLFQTRPVFGGNALATFMCESFPQMATVRAKAMSPLEPDAGRHGEIITIEPGTDKATVRTTLIERVKEEVPGVKLEEADVVVCGGRGIGDTEGFGELEKLAKALEGAVGATRPPCDNGWVSPGLQIGLTGKIVSPDLYIGVAVSGSSQHLTGCTGAKTIIAINKDPEANIFQSARFGVVGDWKQVISGFMNASSREKG
jgi:electron transfer flavoprotein alpha subunit